MDKTTRAARRAAAGIGMIVRVVDSDTLKRIMESKSSDLSRGEVILKDMLKSRAYSACAGLSREFVASSAFNSRRWGKSNDMYIGFSVYPRARSARKKPYQKMSYDVSGLVTIGPYPEYNSWGKRIPDDVSNARHVDLVCAAGRNSPPMTASVLLANAIITDLRSHPGAVYTMKPAETMSVVPLAKRLGFEMADVTVETEGDEEAITDLMILRHPEKKIIKGMPLNDGFVELICDDPSTCFP